jgi:CheY-like chemotaxis protein
MSRRFEMTAVDERDIELDRPLPYAVFLKDGTLLAAAGVRIGSPQRLAILRLEGWRRVVDGETAPSAKPQPASVYPRTAPRLSACAPAPLARTTALVADDMPLARTMLSGILVDQGVGRVIVVEDGKQAVSRFFAETPSLVFLDIDMPNLDGLGALKQIKDWSPDAFVCLVSANGSRTNVQIASEHAVDGFVVKPYTPLNLKRVLARYLARMPPGVE